MSNSTRGFELELTCFLRYSSQARVELAFRRVLQPCRFRRIGLGGGFRFICFRGDEVAGEAARSIGRAGPGTKNKCCALRHVIGVA